MKPGELRIGKYVIVKNCPILFPVQLTHSDVATGAQSAGFFILRISGHAVDVYCWGESASLDLKSNEAADARLIKEFVGCISASLHSIPGPGQVAVK